MWTSFIILANLSPEGSKMLVDTCISHYYINISNYQDEKIISISLPTCHGT